MPRVRATIRTLASATTADQFYLAREDGAFIATFSFNPSVSAAQRAEVTDSVLASWTWTS